MKLFGHILGIAIQATVVGTLLFLAIFRFAGLVGGAHMFQYENF